MACSKLVRNLKNFKSAIAKAHFFDSLPKNCLHFQMACVQGSISHREDTHSSTHHWQWSTSCIELLQELSTLLESYHLGKRNNLLQPSLLTSQSQQPIKLTELTMMIIHKPCTHCNWRLRCSLQPGHDAQTLFLTGSSCQEKSAVNTREAAEQCR